MTLLCQICLTELAESQENYCAVCEPLVDLCEWPLTREEERELMQNCCQAWQERALRAEAELAKFHECADGQCLDWASGVYHSDKVWHKEGE